MNLAHAPLVLTVKVKGALRLGAVSRQAQRLGLTPGLTLADARARHPDLVVAAMDAGADAAWLEALGQRCIAWSPVVALVPPHGLVIDVAGSAHLFGGAGELMAQVEESMASLCMATRLAMATTPEGAMALARHAALPVTDESAALRALPVSALGLEAEPTLALHRAGLKTIGDLATRPASALAARFGLGAVTALNRLLGEEAAPRDPLKPPAPLHFERRFAEPIGHRDAVSAAFASLLGEAGSALEQRGLGGRRFALTLHRSDGAQQHLAIETGLPTRDAALVLRLFDERVESLADPLDPGFGYDSITLTIAAAERLAPSQPELDGSAQEAGPIAELIDRLATRLGPHTLRRLAPQDSHIPEQAQLALPAAKIHAPLPWPLPRAGEPPLRPLFLFDPPQRVEVVAAVPDGPPHRFRWRRKLHEVRLYEGPERIAAEWWKRPDGEHPRMGGLTRDYYRIEDVRGRRFWLFRHGLYTEKPDPKWYLHGLFA